MKFTLKNDHGILLQQLFIKALPGLFPREKKVKNIKELHFAKRPAK